MVKNHKKSREKSIFYHVIAVARLATAITWYDFQNKRRRRMHTPPDVDFGLFLHGGLHGRKFGEVKKSHFPQRF